ncbi:MAG: CheR family methyltransferase [Nitrospinota bacterium]
MKKLDGLPFNQPNGMLLGISDKEFSQLSHLIYKKFGIHLTERKRTLLVSRLQKKILFDGFTSFQDYYEAILADRSQRFLVELVNLITTNTTFFYREKPHFDFFVQTALPEFEKRLKTEKRNDVRVWTAGCSTGEEPYLLAILMEEYFGASYARWDAGVLATDISHRTIEKAQTGLYSRESVKPIPGELIRKYFDKVNSDKWKVKKRVIEDVTFRRFNLMNKHFPFKKAFHVIFCRNVMIYFDEPTRVELIQKFHALLEPGGYFVIGHSESLGRRQNLFKYIQPSVYQKF